MASARSQRGLSERFSRLAKEILDDDTNAWVYADGGENIAANNTTIRCADLKEYLKHSVELTEGWKSLPLTVYFFLVFVLSILLHAQPSTVYQCESALRSVLTTSTFPGSHGNDSTLTDVTEFSDFWPWISEALIPIAWVQVDSAGNTLPESEWGRISTYNQIVGTFTLEQSRMKGADCDILVLQEIANSTCHPTKSRFSQDYLPPRANLTAEPETVSNIVTQAFSPSTSGKFEAWLLALRPVSTITTIVDYLKRYEWVDKYTDVVTLKGVIFNGELSLLSQLHITFTFERGGKISTNLNLQTIQALFYPSVFLYVLDGIWIASLTILMVSELYDMWKFRRNFKNDYLSDHWNLLDWACIIWGYVISGIFLLLMLKINDSVNSLENIPSIESDEYFPFIRTLSEDLQAQLQLAGRWRVMAGSNIFLIMCRFFKSFRAQPRLAIVTRTLRVAAVDFVHFGLVFITIWFCYVCSGYFLFGESVTEFSTISLSGQMCLLILLGEAAFWDLIKDTNFAFASLWFWTYIILVYLVLLNMLIAVLIDTYTQVKSSVSSNAPTLWSQTYDAFTTQRKILRGSLTHTDIINKLENTPKDEILTPESLAAVIGVEVDHSKSIISFATKFTASSAKRKGGISLSDAMKHIRRLNDSFRVAHERLHLLEEQMERQDAVLQEINELVGEFLLRTQPAE